jgi:FAD/FMN-containing dehydrogenase/Fe-S oxidoreductase
MHHIDIAHSLSPRQRRSGAHDWADDARRALEDDLRNAISGEVRFDAGSRGMYATAGANYREIPIGVVVPRGVEDVIAALAVCRAHAAPVLARGGGTSLAGQCCNVAVVFDCSKYFNRLVHLDPAARRASIEPGLILDHLRHAAEEHHLTFGPDPSTHDHCTLGGMIGNNSCGVHSVMAGKTDDNVESLRVITYDGVQLDVGATSNDEFERLAHSRGRVGEIYTGLKALREKYADEIRRGFPPIPRRVSGYNLPWLLPEKGGHLARALVGSEGTCVMVLAADVRLVHSPLHRTLVVLGFGDIYQAADAVPDVLGFEPIGLEGMDDRLVRDIRHIGIRDDSLAQLPDGAGWLLVEFGADTEAESMQRARRLTAAAASIPGQPASRLFDDLGHAQQIWRTREAGLGATAHVTSDHPTWEGWEDSSVPPERLGEYLRKLRALLDRYHYIGDFYGHFGQGCLHTRINFDLFTNDGISTFRRFLDEAADLVVGLGGSLSGEHGDGQSRAELLPKMFSPALMQAFAEFKKVWDPSNRMNPGKIVHPNPIVQNLRYGSDYAPLQLHTHFHFPEEKGLFSRATMRCVGVGECRRTDRGTMCPSFQVTREEMHSTRGRSRLLWEMLERDPVSGAWQSDHVKDALDLCLACKGCKGECPVHVDMATYKAEFLSHYYEHHWRPRSAWAFGLIHWWARAAATAPAIVNFVTQNRVTAPIARLIAGMPSRRRIPAFAGETFVQWMHRTRPHAFDFETRSPERAVVLWPDTFNDHFHPETAIAAVELLQSGGFDVIVPRASVCCGRPLYDYGLLPLARRMLLSVLDALRPAVRARIPVVVLEPSCAAVFRDEMKNLLHGNAEAARLADLVCLVGEFVQRHRARFDLPRLEADVLYHAHCHQKAIFGSDDDCQVLQSIGARLHAPDSGCCGMAGSFGFEADHFDVSIRVGERVLLPEVRRSPATTIVIADGFSCREQIAQTTTRRALHLAQVLRLAQTAHGKIEGDEERRLVLDHGAATAARLPAYAAASLLVAGGALALAGLKRVR